MNGKDDVVVGCITGYNFEQIAPWVNSLDSCGFEGKKVVIVYNIDKEVVDKLTERGYTVLAFRQDASGNYVYKQNFSIVVERFFHIWALFKELKGKHRYLIHTDVKDVVFQKNPSEFLENVIDKNGLITTIVAASESIKYKDEVWGRDNLKDSFGELVYNHHADNKIVNAGTLSGDFDTMLDLFLNVYMISVGGKTHNPDQAAVNILLSQEPYVSQTLVTIPSDAWACQAGTTNDPSKDYSLFIADYGACGSHIPDHNDMVCNFEGEPFYIVHQYDRVPAWAELIRKKYGE